MNNEQISINNQQISKGPRHILNPRQPKGAPVINPIANINVEFETSPTSSANIADDINPNKNNIIPDINNNNPQQRWYFVQQFEFCFLLLFVLIIIYKYAHYL